MLNLTPGELRFYHREGYLLIPGLLDQQQANDFHHRQEEPVWITLMRAHANRNESRCPKARRR